MQAPLHCSVHLFTSVVFTQSGNPGHKKSIFKLFGAFDYSNKVSAKCSLNVAILFPDASVNIVFV